MDKERQDSKAKAWYADLRNWVIVALLAITAAQAVLLFKGRPKDDPVRQTSAVEKQTKPAAAQETGKSDAPVAVRSKESVAVAGVTMEAEYRRYFLIAFDRPIGQDKVGALLDKPAGALNPEVRGSWSWISPFVLRFDAAKPFEPGREYGLSLEQAVLIGKEQQLVGQTYFTLRTGRFQVANMTVREEPAPQGKGQVVLTGQIEFSYEVNPQALAQAFRLIDPLRGEESPAPLTLTTTYPSRWIEYKSAPLIKKQEPRDMKFVVDSHLASATDRLRLGEDYVKIVPLVLDTNLRVESIAPESLEDHSSLKINFSTPVEADAIVKYLTLDPPLKYSVSTSGRELTLSGAFVPGASYALSIAKGLSAADGAVLAEPYAEEVEVPDLPAKVVFQHPGLFLSKTGYKTLAVKSVNTDEIELTIDRVYRNNIFMLLNEMYGESPLFEDVYYGAEVRKHMGDELLHKTFKVTGKQNQSVVSPLKLEKFIADSEPGLYRVTAKLPSEYEGVQRWVLITDIGLVAKKGEDELLVWASSYTDLTPKAGAKVQLISDQNQLIAEGETDENGLWRAANLGEKFKKQAPYMIAIEKDGDFSFLLFDQFGIDTTGMDVGGVAIPKKGYLAYIYGERDIYRPGERAQGVALVRDSRLSTPPSMPLTLRQKDPQGRELSTQAIKSDEKGAAPFSIDIPAYALTGGYSLELLAGENLIGTYRYKVEEFVPDRIKVAIDTPKAAVKMGDTLDFKVESRYFFGPPASGMNVEARVRLKGAPFAPKGYDGYLFGNAERAFEDQDIFAEEDVLDDAGEKSFRVDIPKGLKPPAAVEAVVVARVRERGGRGVAAMQRIEAHAYPYYPGVKKLGNTGVNPGEKVKLEYALVAPDGKEAANVPLQADLYQDHWQTVLRKAPGGGVKYESVRDSSLVSSQTLPAGPAKGAFTVTPPKFGSYRVVLSDPATGAACQTSFFASGWGYSPWAIENPAKVDIVPDKEEYMPGDTAKFQLRAPFGGKLYITVEGDTVFDSQIHMMDGNTADISIPVKEEYSPNVYLTAVVVKSVKNLEPGGVARASGVVPFNVNRSANKPKIEIAAVEQMRPENKLEIKIKTEPEAVVTLAAVDEGILQLIAQDTPDPFPTFYAKRALGIRSFDIFSLLLPEVNPTIGKVLAGGDAALDKMRQFVRTESIRRVKPVSFWSGPLKADAEGRVTYSVDVPEFQGAIRLMAVVSNGRRFSSTHAVTRVRSPLVLTTTLPRFMSTDEHALVPVTLRNDTATDGEFSVRLECQGNAVVAGATKTLLVPKGVERLTYFTVKTGGAEGALKFVCTATGNDETAKSETDVPLRPSLPMKTIVQAGSVPAQSLSLPQAGLDELRPEGATREVQLGRTPLTRFSGSLAALLGYPYGCVEQTVSRVFPLLYFGALAQELDPKSFKEGSPQAMVQRGIARVQTMQIHGGGFGLWPGAKNAHPWGSVYAAHFLVEARRAGFHVSDSVLSQALGYAASLAKGQDVYSDTELERASYALFVLASAGKPDRGTMDFLRTRHRSSFTTETATMLGAAYGAVGDQRAMNELLGGTYKRGRGVRDTGENLGSALRNMGLQLTVLMQTAPDDKRIPALVKDLVAAIDATPYRTTQENVYSLLGLGKFYDRQKKRAPFKGKLFVGDKLLAEFKSEKNLVVSDIRDPGALRIEMDPGYEADAAFYSVSTRGIPTREAYKPVSHGIVVERSLLTRDGAPANLGAVAQGELLVLKSSVKSLGGRINNVVIQNLLPTGLEVENPRLESTEKLPWIEKSGIQPAYQDLRDDRVLLFLDLPGPKAKDEDGNPLPETAVYYSLLRAVTPGDFILPPVQAEAMYNPELVASGQVGVIVIKPDRADEAKGAASKAAPPVRKAPAPEPDVKTPPANVQPSAVKPATPTPSAPAKPAAATPSKTAPAASAGQATPKPATKP
jgi:uncharacterized protein YfaS (alpha-2-macroglobulin family)